MLTLDAEWCKDLEQKLRRLRGSVEWSEPVSRGGMTALDVREGNRVRAAIYARYSSDLQRETSIEDQLAVAKRYAEERGWKVLKDHIYTDAAVSGASINGRAGVQRLLSSAAQTAEAVRCGAGR